MALRRYDLPAHMLPQSLAEMSDHPAPPLLVPDYVRLEGQVRVGLRSSSSPVARLLPPELLRLVVSFLWEPRASLSRQMHNPSQRLLQSSSLPYCTGWVHADTEQSDDWTSELRARVLAGWRLRAVDCWGDRYCNGFAFTYESGSGEQWSTEARKGSHHRPSVSRLQLQTGECIVQVAVRLSKWMECVVFETSRGRRFQVGGRGSRWAPKERQASEWTRAGVTQMLLMPQPHAGRAYEALAFAYGVGGHVHNLGVYYQPLWPTRSPAPAPTASPPEPVSAAVPATPVREVASAAVCEDDMSAGGAVWSSQAYLTHSLQHAATVRPPLLSS